MRERCILAVAEAIGRDITKAEANGIEERIRKHYKFISAINPEVFFKLGPDQRLKMAAELAGKELVQEAELKKRRIVLTIQAHDRIETFIKDLKAIGMSGLEALDRLLAFKADSKGNTTSIEYLSKSIKNNSIRQLIDTFESVDPRIFGLFESPEGVRDLTRAIMGETKGLSPEIVKGAKAWLDVSAQLRDMFNQYGGKIRLLDNWSLPQHHSQMKVGKAGPKAWVDFIFDKLDRRKYLNEDGTLMNDTQLRNLLQNVHETIATGGINKMEPGAQGVSMLENRRAQTRALHFKDADSYLAYQMKFGEKSLWGVMTSHVEALSKEIAQLQTFGPNADATIKLFIERERKELSIKNPGKTEKYREQALTLSNKYDYLTGKNQTIANYTIAQTFDTLRNWMVASRLGSAAVTALADESTIHLTAMVNKLPEVQLIQNELAALNISNREERHLANRAGLGLDAFIGELNRFGQDNLGSTFSSKMASSVMRASMLETLDSARQRFFGVTMLSALGEVVGKYADLSKLHEADYKILASKGIRETEFQIWRQAELEKWGAGNGVLTPESIMRIPDEKITIAAAKDRAALEAEKKKKIAAIKKMAVLDAEAKQQSIKSWSKIYDEQLAGLNNKVRMDAVHRLLAVVNEETDMAVLKPGANEKFLMGEGLQRGTLKGELARSVFQFKAFPLALINKHWAQRGLNMETAGGRAAYLGALIASTTILGAVAQSVNDVLQGKDPRNYNPFDGEHGAKNWMAAFLKGGSLGLYGDFLFSGTTQGHDTSPLAAMLGPTFGMAEDLFKLTQGNIVQAAQGKDTHAGAELVRFIKSNTPGASLWYAKAALDHIIFHNLQEYFSPGYLSQLERRANKEFGQSYFWQPGTGLEGIRAPNFEKMIGQ